MTTRRCPHCTKTSGRATTSSTVLNDTQLRQTIAKSGDAASTGMSEEESDRRFARRLSAETHSSMERRTQQLRQIDDDEHMEQNLDLEDLEIQTLSDHCDELIGKNLDSYSTNRRLSALVTRAKEIVEDHVDLLDPYTIVAPAFATGAAQLAAGGSMHAELLRERQQRLSNATLKAEAQQRLLLQQLQNRQQQQQKQHRQQQQEQQRRQLGLSSSNGQDRSANIWSMVQDNGTNFSRSQYRDESQSMDDSSSNMNSVRARLARVRALEQGLAPQRPSQNIPSGSLSNLLSQQQQLQLSLMQGNPHPPTFNSQQSSRDRESSLADQLSLLSQQPRQQPPSQGDITAYIEQLLARQKQQSDGNVRR